MAAITGGQTTLVVAVLLCTMLGMASAWSTTNVQAKYTRYNPKENGWDLRWVNVYCARWDAEKPLSWRQQYGWAAYCEPWGSGSHSYCGQCMKVTNRATGAWILARIVDKCTAGGLELDYETVFKKIDKDGQGSKKGYLKVDYKFVSC
ncbi:unnamed protein product [Urochloa humidicola]